MSGQVALAVGALFLISAALHIASLVPAQGLHVPAAADEAGSIVGQAVLAAGWLAAAVAVLSHRWPLAACLGAAGLGLAEAGLAVANFAQLAATTSAGAGAWLGLVMWVPGLVGAVGALILAWRRTEVAQGGPPGAEHPGGPRRPVAGSVPLLLGATLVVAVGLGVALLPGWDHYVLISRTLNRTIAVRNFTSAFAHGTPTFVMIGDLLTAIAFVLIPLVAVIWRPARAGVLLSAGVLVVVASQIASALFGFKESPTFFGFPEATIHKYGLVLHSSLTGWFLAELIAGVLLLLLLVAGWRRPAEEPVAPLDHSGAAPFGGGGWPYWSNGAWPAQHGPVAQSPYGSVPQDPYGPVPQGPPPGYER